MSASPTLLEKNGASCDGVRPVVPKEIGRLTEDGLTMWPRRRAIRPEDPSSTWQQPCEHPGLISRLVLAVAMLRNHRATGGI